jgi:glycolate oxidase FAD binding subunit
MYEPLPITETLIPASQAEVTEAVRRAYAANQALFPIGGATSLNYGLAPDREGAALDFSKLNQVNDYQPRDMTITVEAGVTLQQLADTLAAEHQWLPLEVPHAATATVGGMVACAISGSRRYGYGTVRDWIIGISAVDGCGTPFKGGGRVVKNVAGYDFCKLLAGSFGTLGAITQVTFKIRPKPERSLLVSCEASDLGTLDSLLANLIQSYTTPTVIDWIAGKSWNTEGRLVLGFDGTAAEVDWQKQQIRAEWQVQGVAEDSMIEHAADDPLRSQLQEFAADTSAPLVIKVSVRPSAVCQILAELRRTDADAQILAHAGTGVLVARLPNFSAGDVSGVLVGQLQPAARMAGGSCVVLSSNGLGELTRQAQWGGVHASMQWMTKVKQQFDPKNILNPGRFIYDLR